MLTTPDNRETVAEAIEDVPSVERVVAVSRGDTGIRRDDLNFHSEIGMHSREHNATETSGGDDALL